MSETNSPTASPAIPPEQSVPSTLELNRELIKEISKIYSPPEVPPSLTPKRSSISSATHEPFPVGLRSIGQLVGKPVAMSHNKAAVMVIGNISAGKSTFINWYVQESVQRTGMAIETSGFTYVTSGRYVIEIGGEGTLALRPHLELLTTKFKGFKENLSLKTCPSPDGRLHLVDLIDTPGLADGELQYPFDVEEVIYEMRNCVDLFFVFFDPIGQALGSRMLKIVKRLNESCPDKVRFCLTKIDDVRTEEERIKIMCQTTQSLTAKISSRHGFDLVPIFIPGAKDGTYLSLESGEKETNNSTIVNRLKDLISDINRVTERRVQDSLNGLNSDVLRLAEAVDSNLERFTLLKRKIAEQKSRFWRHFFLRFLVFCLCIPLGLLHLHSSPNSFPLAASLARGWIETNSQASLMVLDSASAFMLPLKNAFLVLWAILAVVFISTIDFRSVPRISPSHQTEYSKLLESREFLRAARFRWKQLNQIYLDHSMVDPYNEASSVEM